MSLQMLERAVTEMDGHAKKLAAQCKTTEEMVAVAIATLQRLGGWASVRMVQRYATVTAGHMAEALRRIA